MYALSADDQIQESEVALPFVADDPFRTSEFPPGLTKTSPSLTSLLAHAH